MQRITSVRLSLIGALTRLGKKNLKIEVWDADAFFDDFVAEGVSDAQGRCELSIDEDRYREWQFDRDPDVYFKVYDGPRLVLDTREIVLCNLRPGVHEIVLEIPEPKEDPNPKPEPSKPKVCTISGRAVLSPEWEPGVVIEAFADADLQQLIGFAETSNAHQRGRAQSFRPSSASKWRTSFRRTPGRSTASAFSPRDDNDGYGWVDTSPEPR